MLILYCGVSGFIFGALSYFVPEDLTSILLYYDSFAVSTLATNN